MSITSLGLLMSRQYDQKTTREDIRSFGASLELTFWERRYDRAMATDQANYEHPANGYLRACEVVGAWG